MCVCVCVFGSRRSLFSRGEGKTNTPTLLLSRLETPFQIAEATTVRHAAYSGRKALKWFNMYISVSIYYERPVIYWSYTRKEP